VVAYWLNLVLLGAMLWASVRYAWRAGLMKEHVTAELRRAHDRRILTYQALYAVGAALCVVSTYPSIVFIVVLQLNSVLAPRLTRRLTG
jgi:hypothetical protein